MKVAVVGVTGLVGGVITQVLEERNFPLTDFIPVASDKSIGKEIKFRGRSYRVVGIKEAVAMKPKIAIFSAGSTASLEWAPKFADAGTTVIDNSSAWRMDPTKKLVVPEINASELTKDDKIIANPNCSTIQMVLVMNPLHKKYKIKRVVVSTYQSVTGTGKKAVDQLMDERKGIDNGTKAYPYKIDLNLIPHIDVFLENGYTKEEMKMVKETTKILGDDSIKVTATTVRVPVIGGHSESVNIECLKPFEIKDVRSALEAQPGLIVQDEPAKNFYPMPITSSNRDAVFVGRIRRDSTVENGLNIWVVSDNLRKGAALNAVQIGEVLLQKVFR